MNKNPDFKNMEFNIESKSIDFEEWKKLYEKEYKSFEESIFHTLEKIDVLAHYTSEMVNDAINLDFAAGIHENHINEL